MPRNQAAEPVNAGTAVSIGIRDDTAPAAVIMRPWAVSGSALMTSMVTRAPAGTVMAGLARPAMRKVWSLPGGPVHGGSAGDLVAELAGLG